jgi:hypothetical protein
VLQEIARKRAVGPESIAMTCGVSESRGRQYWYGDAIPEEHAEKLLTLFSREEVRRIYRSFILARIGSGRHAKDGGRSVLRRAARALRRRGKEALAERLEEEAEAIGGGHGA